MSAFGFSGDRWCPIHGWSFCNESCPKRLLDSNLLVPSVQIYPTNPHFKLKRLHKDAIVPTVGNDGDRCFDLYALENTKFKPGEIQVVKTGWALELPEGWGINIYVRSSTPLKKEFMLANSIGIIDNPYRGELGVQLKNIAEEFAQVNIFIPRFATHEWRTINIGIDNVILRGTKFAQFELIPTIEANKISFSIVDELSETDRGTGGFGSTGQ